MATNLDGFVLNGTEYNITDKVAQSRLDNLVGGTNTPTEGNAELLDLRVGYDGQIYDSAGAAVRTQISNEKTTREEAVNQISSEIDTLFDNVNLFGSPIMRSLSTVPNSGFISSEGVIREHSSYVYHCVDVKKGEVYFYRTVTNSLAIPFLLKNVSGKVIMHRQVDDYHALMLYEGYVIAPCDGMLYVNSSDKFFRLGIITGTKNRYMLNINNLIDDSMLLSDGVLYETSETFSVEQLKNSVSNGLRFKGAVEKPQTVNFYIPIEKFINGETYTFRIMRDFTEVKPPNEIGITGSIVLFFVNKATGSALETFIQSDVFTTEKMEIKWVCDSSLISDTVTHMMVQYTLTTDCTPIYYEPFVGLSSNDDYYEATTQKFINACEKKDQLYGKTIVWFGDSIFHGTSASDGNGSYCDRIMKKHSMNGANYGLGGSTLTSGTTDSDGNESGRGHICEIFDANQINYPDADYIILEGGTNDADIIGLNNVSTIGSASLGEYNPQYTGEFNKNTFYGALDYLLSKVTTLYRGKKIGFIIAHKMGEPGTTAFNNRREYFEKVTEVCKKWGVPVLNMWDNFPMNAVTTPDYYTDGQHPTSEGYIWMCDAVELFLKSL